MTIQGIGASQNLIKQYKYLFACVDFVNDQLQFF